MLKLSGILYPPAAEAAASLGKRCEEFSVAELDGLVSDLQDLPVWVEHDETKLVGRVVKARRTHANAVEVEAVVSASTDAGRQAIDNILSKQMVGLSLSHVYNLKWQPGSETDRKLTLAMNHGADLYDVVGNESDINVEKRLRELSICAEPARSGCHIHEVSSIVVASAKDRAATSVSQLTKSSQNILSRQEVKFGINTHKGVRSGDIGDCSVVGVFNCSNMEGGGEQQQQSAPSTAPATQAGAAPATAPATAPTTAPATQAGAAPATAPATQTGAAAQPRGKDGRFVAGGSAPAAEPVADPATEAVDAATKEQADANNMDTAIQTMKERAEAAAASQGKLEAEAETAATLKNACDLVQSMRTENAKLKETQQTMQAKFDESMAALQKQRDEQERVQAEKLKAQEEETARLKKLQEDQYNKALKEAQQTRKKNFEELQATLKLLGSSNAAGLEKPTGELNEQQLTAHEAQVTKAAINTLSQYQNEVQMQHNQNHDLKRRNENMATSLHPFGMVNASAAGDAVPEPPRKTRAVAAADFKGTVAEQMREFRCANPRAVWRDYEDAYRRFSHAPLRSSATGLVEASKGTWTRANLLEPETQPRDLSMRELQGELFDEISKLNTGAMPTNRQMTEIINSINVKKDSRYM